MDTIKDTIKSLKVFYVFISYSKFATLEATEIDQFIANNHVLFHLLWKEN